MTDESDRNRWIFQLLTVLDSGDREAILSEETAQLAAHLLLESSHDLFVYQALGMYYWNRYILDNDESSHATAVDLLMSVINSFPERIPEPLRTDIKEAARKGKTQADLDLIDTAISTNDPAKVEAAVAVCERRLIGSLPGEPGRQGTLANLAILLVLRYDDTRKHEYLSQALTYARRAVSETPQGHRNMAIRILVLGDVLLRDFSSTGDRRILDEALEVYGQAARTIRVDDPRRAILNMKIQGVLSQFGSFSDPDPR